MRRVFNYALRLIIILNIYIMSCGDISANIAFDCLKSQGGLNRVWLANWVEGGVTSLAGVGTGLSSNLTTVYEYAITGNVHNFTETKSSNKDTGTSGTAQVVALTITKTSAEKTAQLNLLSSGRVILFLEDNNKNIHALGLWKGMYFEGSSFLFVFKNPLGIS